MSVQDALEKDSLFSPFQTVIICILSAPFLFVGTHNLMQVFTAAVPPFHCQSNLTFENSNKTEDSCTRYISLLSNHTEPCKQGERIYDLSIYTSTIVSEWDLVCEREWMKELAQSTYMAGVLFGAMLYGTLADRYGRRTVILCCLLQIASMGTGAAFSPNFLAYCIFRFMTGMGICGLVINGLSLTMEWTPKKYRAVVTIIQGTILTSGQIVLPGVAYVVPAWRWLQLTLSLPYFLFPILIWWVPESYRWLALKKRSRLALRNLNRAARMNGHKEGTFITLEMLTHENEKNSMKVSSKPTPFDLFRTPAMRKMTIYLSMSWFSSSFCYFAIALDIQRFGFNLYILQLISGAAEIPLRTLCTVLVAYIGRRYSVSSSLIFSGVFILGSLAIPSGLIMLQLAVTLLAKGFLSSSIVCAYLYTAELYPTELRQTGIGFTNMMMRLGAVVAPVVMMTKAYASFLPLVIFGMAPILCGLPILRLPETLNTHLLDTVEEVEARGQKATVEKEHQHGTKL